jgi:hypothetical protein
MEKRFSKKESLDHVYEEIARLSSQCPPKFRSNANRVYFLKKAVRDEQRALSTLDSHMTTSMNFTTLHTRLSLAIVLHEEQATRNTPARASAYTAHGPQLTKANNMLGFPHLGAKIILPKQSHQAAGAPEPRVRKRSFAGIAERQDTPITYARSWQRADLQMYYASASMLKMVA